MATAGGTIDGNAHANVNEDVQLARAGTHQFNENENNDSDDDVMLEEGGIGMATPDGNNANGNEFAYSEVNSNAHSHVNSPDTHSVVEGDPAVTGAEYGDPQITKGAVVNKKNKEAEEESDEEDAEEDVMYAKGKGNRRSTKGGGNKTRQASAEEMYGVGKSSKGGPANAIE